MTSFDLQEFVLCGQNPVLLMKIVGVSEPQKLKAGPNQRFFVLVELGYNNNGYRILDGGLLKKIKKQKDIDSISAEQFLSMVEWELKEFRAFCVAKELRV